MAVQRAVTFETGFECHGPLKRCERLMHHQLDQPHLALPTPDEEVISRDRLGYVHEMLVARQTTAVDRHRALLDVTPCLTLRLGELRLHERVDHRESRALDAA